MASRMSYSKKPSMKLSSISAHFDEEEWVINIRTEIEEEIAEEDIKTRVSIFGVPKELMSCKEEAYVPQLFAFGPYHHWRPNLYDMERYKLGAARKFQSCLNNGLKFAQIVEEFIKRDYKIRCHYHKYLDMNPETLAWMMALDSCFLLDFLQNYLKKQTEDQQEPAPAKTNSKRMENERWKSGCNMILKDIVKLENQIPLFLLRKLLTSLYSSKELAVDELSKLLGGFINEISPFKSASTDEAAAAELSVPDDITHHAHLLEILYWTIVPKPKDLQTLVSEIVQAGEDEPKEFEELGDTSTVRKVLNCVWRWISNLSGGPFRFIKNLLLSKHMRFLVKLPWKIITALPIFSLLKLPVENFFSGLLPAKPKSSEEEATTGADKPPLVEEISIPSVTELTSTGVKFSPTKDNLTSIRFDEKTITMYLPVVSLDVNTEVLLRNLVVYESSVAAGPLVFTRYTELMNGIVDTDEDVKILREAGIIVNRLKSDGEVADVWNGMSRSVRLSKVGFLDKTIADVNGYYRRRWRVKTKEFMRKYIFDSWKILTFLAAGLLLLMTCVQSFCSVYNCSSRLVQISNVGGSTD